MTLPAFSPNAIRRSSPPPRKQARRDRLYLDVQRIGYAQTSVAPYAVRARPGAPVTMPLTWAEVDDPASTVRRWSLTDIEERLADPDPWQDAALKRGRPLAAARHRLGRLQGRSVV